MRNRIYRAIAFVLALSMFLILLPARSTVRAEEEVFSVSDASDEVLAARFGIPNNWSRPALLFAVRNGLLVGKQDGLVHGSDNATRAELAAILTRVLPTEGRADLSQFTDVRRNAWYADSLSAAVALGLFAGVTSTTMNPNGSLTREQTFAVIARAFGLTPGAQRDLYQFSDWYRGSSWAYGQVAATVNAGYVSGSGKKLNPTAKITRAELAQVLYKVIQSLSPELTESRTGSVVVHSSALPSPLHVDGDLVLCCDDPQLHLTNLTVTGRLVLQGYGPVELTLTDCAVKELVLCRAGAVWVGGGVEAVTVRRDAVTVSGDLQTLNCYATTRFAGTASQILLYGGDLTIAPEASVGTVYAEYTAKGSRITLDGQAGELVLHAKDLTVDGSGTASLLRVEKSGCSVSCGYGEKTEEIDGGLGHLELTRTDTAVPDMESPLAELRFLVSGLPALRDCDLVWYLDNKYAGARVQSLDNHDDLILSADFRSHLRSSPVTLRVKVLYEDETRTIDVPIEIKPDYYAQAKQIRSAYVKATIRYDCNLYRYPNSGYVETLKAGTVVTYEDHQGTSFAQVVTPEGRWGWVNYYAISIDYSNPTVTWDYATEVKECWVNEVQGYSSNTGYLCWVSLYTQRVNVFQGSKGNWKLIKTFPCCSGANYCPTVRQITTIRYKTSKWYFDDYYVSYVSVLDTAGRAFHSILYSYNDKIYDDTMGRPASHGCLRMWPQDTKYIYDNVPTGTAVVIY